MNPKQHPKTRAFRKKALNRSGAGIHKQRSNKHDRRSNKQAIKSDYLGG